ncbi:MAG: transposase [Desulfobacterales bacterium]|nr:transposase [Desulfobacterales bacterium]
MKITRASKTTINFATKKKREILNEIMDEYAIVVNFFIDYLWEHPEIESKNQIIADIYNLSNSWFTARMKQCAAREALSMVLGAKNNKNRRKSPSEIEVEELLGEEIFNEPIKPKHYGKRMVLSSQVVRIETGRNSFDLWLVLYSIGNGIKLYIPLKKHRQMNQWFSMDRMSNSVTLYRECVQFSFEIDIKEKKTEGILVGMDAGINHLIATSDKEFLGNEIKPLIAKIKKKLQGSKAYKRAKKTLSYYLHKIIKDYFKNNGNLRIVVVEKLKDLKIGKRNRSKEFRKTLSNWNYMELLDIIQMRCEENRVSFRSVSPYKTSQRCPSCSHTERENRKGEEFKCLKCGFLEQADYVGSLNILWRFLTGRYGAGFKTDQILLNTIG